MKSRLGSIVRTTQSAALILVVLFGLSASESAASSSESFGERLAAAALSRTWSLVIYNPKYIPISYPGGDVPSYFGVCTDVVIRSYRALGIDLQEKIYKAYRGDKNIAHRRVRTQRKFFARFGKSLPKSTNPADYKPGDIVTYFVPDAWYSKDHVAIVSSRKSSSGNPLIIHNRGYGPQIEDALFAEKITGHYRYAPKT